MYAYNVTQRDGFRQVNIKMLITLRSLLLVQ